MSKIILGDIFKGDYPITQYFGANPDYYGQWGLAGHEGLDFGCPNGTELISPFPQSIVVRADDYGNYGKHIVLWDYKQQAAVWYAHCQKLLRNVGDSVMRGTTIALSNNTGNSTGPHLHFSVCRTDENGIRLNQDNGYIGMLDPLKVVDWQLEDSQPPTDPDELQSCLTAHKKLMDVVREREEQISELNNKIVKKDKKIKELSIKVDHWDKTTQTYPVKNFVELDNFIRTLQNSSQCDEVLEKQRKDFVKRLDQQAESYQEKMKELRKMIIDPNKLTTLELIKLLLGVQLNEYTQNK